MLNFKWIFVSVNLGLSIILFESIRVSGFQCYTSEYYAENSTIDYNITITDCSGFKRNYCLTQKYTSIGNSAAINGLDTNRLVYGYCGHIVSLNVFNPIIDKLFQYYILDVAGSWSLHACMTSKCNNQTYMMKIYNDNSTCEVGSVKSNQLIYPAVFSGKSVKQCFYCVQCNFTNQGVIRTCKSNNPFQAKFTCAFIYHNQPKNGTRSWSGGCDTAWLYSSVKTDRLIEKVITCSTELCNTPLKMSKLEDAFLCDDGFYLKNRTIATTSSSQLLFNNSASTKYALLNNSSLIRNI